MSRQRFIVLLVAALIVISGAYYVSTQRNASRETAGVALLPGLAQGLNTVTSVAIRKGSATPTLTLHQLGKEWTVAERADYPADVSKLRKLLESLRDAKIIEEKTADPARFASIGVEDPVAPGATGAEVSVKTASGTVAVIVGKPVGEGSFVRRAGENRTYSVEPAITFETEPKFWIDSRLIDVPVALIQNIQVKPAAGSDYVLHRLNPADNTYALEGAPAGRKPLDGHALAPSSSMFTGLTAEDVAPAANIDFGRPSVVNLTLTDGNVITLTGIAIADKHWIQVKSSKDAALTAKSSGRAFEIASYRYDAIFKPVDQLLIPKEPPAPKGQSATKPPPAPKSSAAAPARPTKKPVPPPPP